MIDHERAAALFKKGFDSLPPSFSNAPGRINLIGEHTDYNDGFVFPMGIDRRMVIAFRRRKGSELRLISDRFHGVAEIHYARPMQRGVPVWARLAQGMVLSLRRSGAKLYGADAAVISDVPMGGGLSSSAAFSVALAGVVTAAGFRRSVQRVARAAQEAEHLSTGTRCGIMDPYVSLVARSGAAFLLDCQTLKGRHIPLPEEMEILQLDSEIRRELAGSEYNLRRQQCEQAAKQLRVSTLRRLDGDLLERARRVLDPLLFRRVRHVVTENERTRAAASLLRHGDLANFGVAMNESHDSLRDDYEVSCPEVDKLVALAREEADCYGARITGGGFGGSVVAAVRRGKGEEIGPRVIAEYRKTFIERRGHWDVFSPADGASVITETA